MFENKMIALKHIVEHHLEGFFSLHSGVCLMDNTERGCKN